MEGMLNISKVNVNTALKGCEAFGDADAAVPLIAYSADAALLLIAYKSRDVVHEKQNVYF
jgi:hypothetical protein